MFKRDSRRLWPSLFLALWCCWGHAQPLAKPSLILGVQPYLPVEEIQQRFAPLADYLGRQLGRPVEVRVGESYEDHIAAIGQDRLDIAFLGPTVYVKLVARYGPKPLLARFEVNGQPDLRGVIAVRRDSPLQRLEDLKGRRFAFGEPDSTMGYVMPRFALGRAGVPLSSLAHHGFLHSHKNVALALLVGDYDAGALKREVFDEFAPQGLRVLAELPTSPDHLFVTSNKLPPADVEQLRRALLQLHAQPGGHEILDKLHKGMTALIPAEDAQYDGVRQVLKAVEAETP